MKKILLLVSIIAIVSCSKESAVPQAEQPVVVKNEISNLRINPESSVITSDEAINVVKLADMMGKSATKSASRQIADVVTISDANGAPLMYAVNYADGQGYTLVSATKDYYPILAQVDNGSYDNYVEGTGVPVLVDSYKSGIDYWSKQHADSLRQFRNMWREFEKTDVPAIAITKSVNDIRSEQVQGWISEGANIYQLEQASTILPSDVYQNFCMTAQVQGNPSYDYMTESYVVELPIEPTIVRSPMLSTSWKQTAPYNYSCPVINGAYAYVGCGPLAAAQIMKYHQWPSNKAWSSMPNVLSATGATVLSNFLYELAVNCKTNFKETGSWTRNGDIYSALINVYGYLVDSPVAYSESLARSSVNSNRPVILQGTKTTDNTKGHIWVCDGTRYHTPGKVYVLYVVDYIEPLQFVAAGQPYEDLESYNYYMYHMNWGWGGTYDGWYLNEGFPYNNNYSREMHQMTNIRPNR